MSRINTHFSSATHLQLNNIQRGFSKSLADIVLAKYVVLNISLSIIGLDRRCFLIRTYCSPLPSQVNGGMPIRPDENTDAKIHKISLHREAKKFYFSNWTILAQTLFCRDRPMSNTASEITEYKWPLKQSFYSFIRIFQLKTTKEPLVKV